MVNVNLTVVLGDVCASVLVALFRNKEAELADSFHRDL